MGLNLSIISQNLGGGTGSGIVTGATGSVGISTIIDGTGVIQTILGLTQTFSTISVQDTVYASLLQTGGASFNGLVAGTTFLAAHAGLGTLQSATGSVGLSLAIGTSQQLTAYLGLTQIHSALGISSANLNALDVNGGVAIGAYAGISTAPANGLIVSGSVGVGTNAPLQKVHIVTGATAAPAFRADLAMKQNATVAVTLGAVGCSGSATTVQGWLVINIDGTERYMPFW